MTETTRDATGSSIDGFAQARRIADVVLYEGYVLYPYRASAIKNRYRWQFGVVAPRDHSESSGADPWFMEAEALIEPLGEPVLDLELRYLQVEERQVEEEVDGKLQPVESLVVAGVTHTAWQEGEQQTVTPQPTVVREVIARPRRMPFHAGATASRQELIETGRRRGRVTRRRWAIEGTLEIAAEWVGPYLKVRLRIENETPTRHSASGDRAQALRSACIGTHVLAAVSGGRFLSLADPPSAALAAADSCRQQHAWPVLMGEPGCADTILVSPIILEDHPRLAPESPGDLYDATEIDEILTLRVMTMTDEEKAEARSTDERARRIIERSDSIPDEVFARLHGAIRSLRPVGSTAPERDDRSAAPVDTSLDPWRELLEETTPAEEARIQVGSALVARGSRVRIHPRREGGARRTDAMDMFLDNRIATVSAIHRDVEDRTYIAVTLDDDPAQELHDWYGRFYYFYPEEIEPIDAGAGSPSARESKE